MNIHSTAIISPNAQVSNSAFIGPYCIIGDNVVIKDGVKLHSHVCIDGITTIGENTEIFPFASIGKKPQDLKYRGEKSTLVIGKNNTIREYVTIHPGTETGSMTTVIGDGCLIMISVHIAHDCIIGNNVILANNASLAGHVEIGEGSIIGGMSGFRQFVRVGKGAIIGGGSMVSEDIIPHASVMGARAYLAGLNITGMKRKGVPKEQVQQLIKAFDDIFHGTEQTLEQRLHNVTSNHKSNPMIQDIMNFIKRGDGKAICLPKRMKNLDDNNQT